MKGIDYRAWSAALAMALTVLCSGARAAAPPPPFCGGWPPPGFDRPPNLAHVGAYRNSVYRYGVRIPAGFTAYSDLSGPDTGFTLVLSWAPRAVIRVTAMYDAFYDITAAGVHRRLVNAVTIHNRLLSDQGTPVALDQVEGGRYLTDVQCPPDPQIFRHDEVTVLVNREIYRVDLQTTPERYAADVRVLNAMLHSWRWVNMGH